MGAVVGKASFDLVEMPREGLLVGVRGAVHKAKRDEAPAREEGLRVKSNGGYRKVNVQVIPFRGNSGTEHFFLVLFEGAAQGTEPHTTQARPESAKARPHGRRELGAAEGEIARLKQELAASRECLHDVIEPPE